VHRSATLFREGFLVETPMFAELHEQAAGFKSLVRPFGPVLARVSRGFDGANSRIVVVEALLAT
jgi:hypothetical protein